MRILGTIGRRTVLLGTVGALAAAGVIVTAAPAFADTPLTLSTIGGPSGGGNVITATVGSATFTAGDPTSAIVQFQWRAAANLVCTTGYGTPGAPTVGSGLQTGGIINATVTVPDTKTLLITVPSGLTLVAPLITSLYNICVYPDTSTTAQIASTEAGIGYTIATNKLSLSTYQGPSGGTNTITATTSGGSLSGSLGAEFQNAGTAYCSPTYVATAVPGTTTAGTVLAPSIAPLTPTKVAVTVPTLLVVGAGLTANYNLCIYNGTTDTVSTLIAGTALPYAIATAAVITGVSPAAGPAQGGTLLTVTGTAFAAGMTVTLAGQALLNIVLTGTTSFTATIPPHAAGGPFNLVLTTLAGPAASVPGTGKTTTFTYTNGIVVAPNTAPNTSNSRTWVDVRGVGFADSTFGAVATNGTTSNSSTAHVYLVRGSYDPKPTVPAGTIKTNPQVLECVDVVVIDDTELICGLFLAGSQTSTTTTRTVTGCTAVTGTPALIGSACLFTAADIGMAVTGTGIAPNTSGSNASTTILAVGATGATLSKNAAAAVSGNLTLTSSRTISDASIASGAALLTSVATPFNAADVGKAVSAPGVLPNGTVILSVNPTGSVATVSNNATAAAIGTGANAAMTIFTPYPVPVGTYTITVVNNGSVNAQAVLGYTQSIISSGSTYTVADYLR